MSCYDASPAFQSPASLHVGSIGGSWVLPSTSDVRPSLGLRFRVRQAASSRLPDLGRLSRRVRTLRCSAAGWDDLTAAEFDERAANSSLALCFVGMSNCGKSHWSRQLRSQQGFSVVCVDDEIEHAIEPELSALGYAGIDGMAEWMGFPSDDRFAANQARYLGFEESITGAVRPAADANCVLDTTGSVVYLSAETRGRLRNEFLVVHLEASDDMLEFMTHNYFETPKPVVWGDAYRPVEGESANEALRRCYPDLLRERRKRYAAMSHVSVPASVSLSREVDLHTFLEHIKGQLR